MSVSFEAALSRSVEAPQALDSFGDTSIELLDSRSLLRRVDRKYLVSKDALNELLPHLTADYRILRTAGQPAARYHTGYFDTPDRRMYEDHRRGRFPRYKIRARHHVDRRMSFLEIKCKKADRRTRKSVLERPFGTDTLDADALRFIDERSPIRSGDLIPSLSMVFHRATLVGERIVERVTVDWGLELFDDRRRESLPHLVIVEIKQGRYSNQSPAVRALRALHVREQSISKYCLATARLAAVRANTFRQALTAVEKLPA